MNLEFSLFIQGSPAPGGSKSAFVLTDKATGQPRRRANGSIIVNVTDAGGERNKKWKADATIQARSFMKGAKPFEEPIKVEFVFYLRRPQIHYRTGQWAHMLRPDAPEYHTQAPDALKYARGTEDALTGVVWKDDSQNVRICAEKRWMKAGEKEGCAVRIVVLRSEAPAAETQP